MIIELRRKNFGPTSTVGEMIVNGKVCCVILEDKVRDLNMDGDLEDAGEGKIYGETAIPYSPEGKPYKIQVVQDGTIHASYLKKDWAKLGFPGFEKIYCGQLMVTGIDGYKRVMIHIGNYITDTLGCPLTGMRANLSKDPYTVSASTQAYVKFYKEVINAAMAGTLYLKVCKG